MYNSKIKFMRNNLLKLPGLVDVHVHLREPGNTQKEDFETGTRAAIAGGYTQILDMPNNIPPTITLSELNKKIKLASDRIYCDLGFNFGATTQSIKHFRKVSKKVFGLKVYMNQTTGTLLVDKLKDREQIFKSWGSPLPIMVHAEGKTIEIAIKLAKKYKKSLHICHVTPDQLKTIQSAKNDGLAITSEVCPHHLFLNKGSIKKLRSFGLMKPPLLSKVNQQKLWKHLKDIDMISTDHAPHTIEEKLDKASPKFGVPGLETTLPVMLNAVSQKKITIERLIEMLATNPRKIFRLPNQQNTYVLVDLNKRFKITNKNLFTKCGWTPFNGLNGIGKINKVVVRGKTVFQNNKFKGIPKGRIIYPNV